MKIAIPTNDGLSINHNILASNGFLVVEIESGRVLGSEMRLYSPKPEGDHEQEILSLIGDCETFLSVVMEKPLSRQLTRNDMQIMLTSESMIPIAVKEYIEQSLRPDHCCCCS